MVNLLIAEMCITLGQGMHDLVAAHWSSDRNEVVDKLSRVAEGAGVPPHLRHLPAASPSRNGWAFFHF